MPARTANYQPDMSVQYLPGVGPKMAASLARLEIRTVEDLLHYYPRAWEDRRLLLPLKDARPGDERSCKGRIVNLVCAETRKGFAIVTAWIEDGSGRLACRWLRKKSYYYDVLAAFKKELVPGKTLLAYGKVGLDMDGRVLQVEEHEVLDDPGQASAHMDRIVPIYAVTEGIRPKFLRSLVHRALTRVSLRDPLPAAVLKPYKFLTLAEAVRKIHFPKDMEERDRARTRLAFQELFMVQAVLAIARKRRQVARAQGYQVKKTLLTPFREKCGFDFTRAQRRVINEIFADMRSRFPMNRLLQGDVGSGKTVVALSAMLLAAENGFQSALMAPTEILAEQHFINLKHFLEGLPVRVGLLTGSQKGAQKKELLEQCAGGGLDVVIGTHALLEKDVAFARLGLVVIDEQHRFGVRHRLLLTQRKPAPDVLVMSATPIPRTLALGLYGDLDVSTIDELPPGRQPIRTLWKGEQEAWDIARREIARGCQAYVVVPMVDAGKAKKKESGGRQALPLDMGEGPLKAAVQEFNRLKEAEFKGVPMALLHGRMPGKKKEEAMVAFQEGRTALLVATTVVEVGIDVPKATVIVIQNAERFGLATLHQLRGRVGRGRDPSCCVLVADPKTEEGRKRIEAVLRSQDGFELAETDLALRGPGEMFGTSQHGMPPLQIADFSRDRAWVVACRASAQKWVDGDPGLERAENAALRDSLRRRFSQNWFWANIV